MNILFTCVGRRHYLIEYFQQAKPPGALIVGADMQATAPAMAVVDKGYIVPSVYSKDYITEITDICRKENINAIISLNDLELPILSENENHFLEMGVKIVVSSKTVIDVCFDKWKTIEFAQNIGIATPKTYLTLEDAVEDVNKGELEFPLVIKPRWGSASIGIEFPENVEELNLAYSLIKKKLFRSMLSEASMVDEHHAILIQEKIKGTEFGIDILNDFTGQSRQVYVKEKLAMRAGETDKSVLRNRQDIELVGEKIGNALKHIGNLDTDIFEKDGKLYLLEMNPRFGGGYPFTHLSGGNFSAAIYAWLKGEAFASRNFEKVYDKVFAKCDTLISVLNNH
jgi:carbamoyl-phosphate synthase large subunit